MALSTHSAFYGLHKQVHNPTGIEHCLYCNFMSPYEQNLVISGVSQLHVYRLNGDVELPPGKSGDKPIDPKQRKHKLECLASFSLFGNIMSMQKVRLAGASRDALLLSFSDAKLSMVEYDPSTHDLKTSSLHYFEEDDLKDGFQQQRSHIPIVRVDPDNRCAAMIIYGTRVVIMPFRREGTTEESDTTPGIGKTPILPTYVIDVRKLDEKIINVIDMQFLHGYYEPTLLILYEPLPTWAARVAVRKDSCSIVAISLNIQQKVHPIIWSVSGMPFDCIQALAVPKPIGGVLVFAVNSLIYLNQSVPAYGVALNSLTDFSTEFILKPQEGVKISLDCAQACLVSGDKLVMSLKAGELYVVTLIVDGMRCVRNFNFDKAAASVLTTCMCMCEDGYIFLGSRLGNSLLLKYVEKTPDGMDVGLTIEEPTKKEKLEEPPNKKKRLDTLGDWIASNVSELDDIDELEVYGKSETHTGTQITAYTFEVSDSIMNIGPCGTMLMGEPAFLSEEFGNSTEPDIELVSTSGYSKNGALSVLQRSIRPQVVTTFELPGCNDMWTVVGDSEEDSPEGNEEKEKKEGEEEEEAPEKLEGGHGFLILSRDDSTMILKTGQEIMELDHSGFSTQGKTIHAGNMGNNRYILQVSSMGVRLLEGVKQIQHIPIDVGSPIVHCSVSDPYAVILSEEGQIMMLNLRQDSFGGGARLAVMKPQISQKSKAITLCTYRDVSGVFSTTARDSPDLPVPETPKATMDASAFELDKSIVDDEDELLYGETEITVSSPTKTENVKKSSAETSENSAEIKPTYWTAVARESGILEIFSLPDFKLCFLVKSFPMGHKILVDNIAETLKSSAGAVEKPTEMPVVKELLIVGLGNKNSRPHLMARVDDELLVYEAFPFHHLSSTDEHLKVRFKKIQHGTILRDRKKSKSKKRAEDDEPSSDMNHSNWIRPFSDIAGYSGVFICGPFPHWLFMTARGSLRIHPMSIDGPVTSFTPFHNVNCPKGFLYFNKQGELRISVLPTHLSYDAPWPVRKVPLRCTPHYIAYHIDSKTYAVVTSQSESCNKICKLQPEGDKGFETVKKDDRFIYPFLEKYSVQLFSPVSWEAIPNTRLEMDDFETACVMKFVNLRCEGTLSGKKGYIAIGSNWCYGEEISTRGKITIFDVIEVVPEPGQPLTKNKIKVLYDKEQKGPVTALENVEGFLISAIGQKIYIWQLKDNDLSGVAFIDTQIYIHHMCTIKNLILVADMCKSISLLRYQQDMKVLSLVSRDVKPLEVYSSEYLVDNTHLTFLVSDRDKNLLVYSYQPEARESHGGQRLLKKADMNLGSNVNTFFRIRCKQWESNEKMASGNVEKKHITFYASLDGGIGFILPVAEKLYRRLLMLQNMMNTQIPHYAGLNPKAYRSMRCEVRGLYNPQRNILDGDLLWKYLHFSVIERIELAKKIGTTADQLVDDLMEIDRITAHF